MKEIKLTPDTDSVQKKWVFAMSSECTVKIKYNIYTEILEVK